MPPSIHTAADVPLPLLPGWSTRLAAVPSEDADAATVAVPCLPRSPVHYAGQVNAVVDPPSAQNLVELAQQRPLTAIGFRFCYGHDRPAVRIGMHRVNDLRSIRPTHLALALAEPQAADRLTVYCFVIDLQAAGVLERLAPLFRLPCVWVTHQAHTELLCLLQLGLPVPRLLWDCWIAEKALHLGRAHKNYAATGKEPADPRRVAHDGMRAEEQFYALRNMCQRHGLSDPFARAGRPVGRTSGAEAADGPVWSERATAALQEALAAVQLYPLQSAACTTHGILQHLINLEMPWVETNARMVWRGVRIDRDLSQRALQACDQHLATLQPRLAEHGITNVRSDDQLAAFFNCVGLADLFRRHGQPCFDKNLLRDFQDRHPAIPLIRAARRVHDLLTEQVLNDTLVGADGRVHPDHRQLGTHTGRQTCRWPNLLGLGRLFRPLIVPEPGYGLGEADWSQIEVGITAAVYHDETLIDLFNADDVYSGIAKVFFRTRLSAADLALPGSVFKHQFRALRDQVKTCTLGILYGLTPYGLAQRLGTTPSAAAQLLEQFLAQFPALRQARSATMQHSAVRGYAMTVTGLRRYRAGVGPVTNWERNWLVNFPVQGSAAAVFKAAGNRLDRLYRRHDAWLLVPLHDAFLFEAPLAALAEVAALTERVMVEAVQEHFPELQPHVDVNLSQPQCWNKDSHADSVERWLADPLYTF